MKKKIIVLSIVTITSGLFVLSALARSEKAGENVNLRPAETQVVQPNKYDKDQVDNEKNKAGEVVNQNKVKTQIENSGEDKNIKNSTREELIDSNSSKKDKKIKEVGQKISKDLKDIADKEPELKNKLVKLADDLEENQEEVADSVKKFENKNKVKTFFAGTDYKNLGQLRSSMVQNGNQIRQLTQLIEQTEDEEIKTALQDQLMTMSQEREEINNFIKEEESTFSLFGWAFRLINGYPKETVDAEEELTLQEEIEEALAEDEEQGEDVVDNEDGSPAVPMPIENDPEIIL